MQSLPLTTLVGLNLSCQFLYQAFHQSPTEAFVDHFVSDRLWEQWPVDTQNDRIANGLERIMSVSSNEFAALSHDYAALFIGPNTLKAAPWASVYLTLEQQNCGEPTLAVRAFYQAYGVVLDTPTHEPDDHIGLMFAFLAYLSERAIQSIEADELEESQRWLAAIPVFLTDHMLTWAPRFF